MALIVPLTNPGLVTATQPCIEARSISIRPEPEEPEYIGDAIKIDDIEVTGLLQGLELLAHVGRF